MISISQIKIRHDGAEKDINAVLHKKIAGMLRLKASCKFSFDIVKHSVDARKKPDIFDVYTVKVSLADFADSGKKEEDFVSGLGNSNIRSIAVNEYKLVDTLLNDRLGECFRGKYEFADLSGIYPGFINEAVIEAFDAFEKKIRGFSGKDTVLAGVESRTSSPIRITRGKDYQSLNVKGLYPCGEGAGYAGGIMSAALDGINVAESIILCL